MARRAKPDTSALWAFRADDAQVLRALASGMHTRALKEYFGETDYCELRALAAAARRQEKKMSARQRGRRHLVLILPGIMGSKLGKRATATRPQQMLWIDPLRIGAGGLTQLALPAIKPARARCRPRALGSSRT